MGIPEIGQFTHVRKKPALVRNVEIFKGSRSGQDLHMIEVDYIHDECNFQGIPVEFRTLKTGFMTVFYRESIKDDELGEKLGEKLGENEERILLLMRSDDKISITALAKKMDISTTAVENNIKKLKEKGFIKRIGPAKGGLWIVIE